MREENIGRVEKNRKVEKPTEKIFRTAFQLQLSVPVHKP